MKYARNDPDAVEAALAPIADEVEHRTPYFRHWVALLRKETGAALEYYASAVEQGEGFAIDNIRGSLLKRKLFPEFFADERYGELLRTYGLDSASIARLRVPPLPL